MTAVALARTFGVSERTVYRWQASRESSPRRSREIALIAALHAKRVSALRRRRVL